jgi:hypothetical protein
MSRGEALGVLLVGFAGVMVGLTWALGPWALVGSSVLLVAFALLAPERERREPAEPAAAPRT